MVKALPETKSRFHYDAFISYRHVEPDITVARKLHRLLENYKIPGNVHRQTGIKKIERVFRDQEELPTSGNLSDNIQNALTNSKYLIVVCSPNTPRSKWCCQEIETFRKLHGSDRILSLLIEGEPEDAFPHTLRIFKEMVKNPDGTFVELEKEVEPLAADIRSTSTRGMWKRLKVEKLRLLAPMLGVSFDALRQRHRERIVRSVIGTALGVSVFLAAFGGFSLYQSQIIAAQSAELSQSNEEIKAKNAELENTNKKLQDQIDETRRQKDLAEHNGNEASRQAKAAEDNLQLAQANEKKALENLHEAEIQRKLALSNEKLAVENADKAVKARITAEDQRNQALSNQSIYLTGQSKQQLEKGDRMAAIMLALEACPGI